MYECCHWSVNNERVATWLEHQMRLSVHLKPLLDTAKALYVVKHVYVISWVVFALEECRERSHGYHGAASKFTTLVVLEILQDSQYLSLICIFLPPLDVVIRAWWGF
jgi:hypothetical protein